MYEKFTVGPDGTLVLSDHTAKKADVAVRLLKKLSSDGTAAADTPITVLDVGCAEGALAAHLVDVVPGAHVTALNGSAEEMEVARGFAVTRPRLAAVTQTVQDFRAAATATTFDVTLWLAIAHHLLRHSPPADVAALIASMTTKCALVEVPVGADVLLADIVSKCPGSTHHRVLASPETVVAWLSSDFAQVRHLGRIPYDNSPTLFRHMFLCYKMAPPA